MPVLSPDFLQKSGFDCECLFYFGMLVNLRTTSKQSVSANNFPQTNMRYICIYEMEKIEAALIVFNHTSYVWIFSQLLFIILFSFL